QTYVISVTPDAPIPPTDIVFDFAGANTTPAVVLPGINTLQLSASPEATPDIVALAASGDPGIVDIPGVSGARAFGASGTGVFAVATVNVGVGGTITATADTGNASLPVTITICQTNPVTGACRAQPAASASTTINAGDTPTFGIFVTGSGPVPFDPANNRVFVRFKDAGGVTRGATSVAVRTQ